MGEACRAFDTPVTGGNVSFYNEGPNASVYPTPVIGMLGVIEDLRHVTGAAFRDQGDVIILLGETAGQIGGSEYLSVVHNIVAGEPPSLDLGLERRVQSVCLESIRTGMVKSAHDCSEGGLAVALAEGCILGEPRIIGATVSGGPGGVRPDMYWLGEDQSRILLTVSPGDERAVLEIARRSSVAAAVIGTVGGRDLRLGGDMRIDTVELRDCYFGALEALVESSLA
jgi:phosphoribosylformylglycinamidine synthase